MTFLFCVDSPNQGGWPYGSNNGFAPQGTSFNPNGPNQGIGGDPAVWSPTASSRNSGWTPQGTVYNAGVNAGWTPGANGWTPGALYTSPAAANWAPGALGWTPGTVLNSSAAANWMPGANGWTPGALYDSSVGASWIPGDAYNARQSAVGADPATQTPGWVTQGNSDGSGQGGYTLSSPAATPVVGSSLGAPIWDGGWN